MLKKPFVLMSLCVLMLMTVFVVSTLAQDQLDAQAFPTAGRVNLNNGFTPDPFAVELVSSGAVDVTYISGCRGFAAREPDFVVSWSGDGDFLRLFFLPQVATDTTLIINDPRGRWYCSDNSFETDHPTINVTRPRAGDYQIWIGSIDAGDSETGCLFITQSQTVNPGASGLTTDCEPPQEPIIDAGGTSLLDRLSQLNALGADITQVAFAPNDGWIILYNDNDFYSEDIPSSALDTLTTLQNDGERLDHIAFTASGGWAIIYNSNGYWVEGIPQRALDALVELNGEAVPINFIEFFETEGWVIIYNDFDYWYRDIPSATSNRIEQLYDEQQPIRWVTFTNDGDWVIFYGLNGYYSEGLPQDSLDTLTQMNTDLEAFNMIDFDSNENWAVLYNDNDFQAEGLEANE